MGKISIDLSSIKAAGIYTLEIDNTQREITQNVQSLRMLVGFNNKGTFNRPVLLERDADRLSIFGDVDTKLEHKGCYFNKMLRTLLNDGPVIALNLLQTNNAYDGPDQVNYAAFSLSAGVENPKLKNDIKQNVYGEYDYLAETLDNTIYKTAKGDKIPFVGTTPFASLYDRTRFWIPDKNRLQAEATRGITGQSDIASFEYSNLLNFGNVGTEEFSILVFKPTNMNGYDVTAESWYGGKENIPFGWIRPYDYISDYFMQVVCVKGNWTNYAVLATDPVWGNYFDKKGIIKDKINAFMGAEGITIIGSWTGIIIPDFVDKQGNNLSLEKKINAATERTGLLISINTDALNVLTYDYSGKGAESGDPDQGCWGIDIDGSKEITDDENIATYTVDMCGHEVFMYKEPQSISWTEVSLETIIKKDKSVIGSRHKPYYAPTNLSRLTEDPSADIVIEESSETKGGIFIDTNVIALDSSIADTENNVKSIIKNNYYIIGASGAIQTKTISLDSIKITRTPENGDKVEARVMYGPVDCKIEYNITVENGFITAATLSKILKKVEIEPNELEEPYYGINFLSYNYVASEDDGVQEKISHAYYFSDITLWGEEGAPVSEDVKNMFIITNAEQWADLKVKLNDYVQNITYKNKIGEAEQYNLIPGLSRVIKKQFIQITDANTITYKGKKYVYNGETDIAKNNSKGFYLITCTAPVLIEGTEIVRQLPITDDRISHSLRFIPMKGLQLSSRHRPGYDASGDLNIEEGIEKIYSVLNDEGIKRGLMNESMISFRYIVDSMSYGLRGELGGKRYLSEIAEQRGSCTAILNLPAAKQFTVSSNPYFCDTFIPGRDARPGLQTKYIPEGGNTEMGATSVFSLPFDEKGKFTCCVWPNLIYTENGKTTSVPASADVCNVLNRKFTGVNDPYCICANTNGVISNRYVTDVEFLADKTDREYLEPFGVNTIIKEQGKIMIYGNQTAYQAQKSDLNKLHVRENLNTAEIECSKVIKKYNFLYNTAAVRADIVQQLTPILQAMQISGALAKYEIICDESNNTTEVIEADACIIDINLWFNHGMEKIVQRFTINRYTTEK